ncbi:hypothetical protein [Fimbriimonas ginsengisoli]|uniref:Uncharacterized protein n=1 Tax=Fimbriimonas ginsengisoli Gsoil 348 TaxID=661478 RepID=A0A068NSS9_FIMGI|nr:hypothetical protein [Fimbriimonas ginsengisoli]AIE85835.1 hypothetical protein OP10G_2467 [Fimbriimonas ginsengisoli Gsoil 348]
MNNTTPEIRDLARRLLANEDRTSVDAAVGVCQELRQPLIKLAGTEGFRALLSRALSLAKTQDPLLAGLRVGADGALERFEPLDPQTSHSRWAEAEVQLIAQLLALLATFIGQPLTLQLVRGIWPNLADEVAGGGNNS